MAAATRESSMLFEHGTLKDVLPAGALVGAAVRDLSKRESAAMTDNGSGVRYAFVAAHVRGARGSVQRLLSKAISDIGKGQSSGKLNTRRLYYSPEKLTEALALAKDMNLA